MSLGELKVTVDVEVLDESNGCVVEVLQGPDGKLRKYVRLADAKDLIRKALLGEVTIAVAGETHGG